MSINSKYTPKAVLARALSKFLDKYNNPALDAAEQAELYGMVFRDAGYNARLVTGHVWVPHKKHRPPIDESVVKHDANFGAYRLPNHVWVKVEPLIVDLRLRRVLGSEHPSIPNGVFEPMIYPTYRYHELAEVKFYNNRERIEELYHRQHLPETPL